MIGISRRAAASSRRSVGIRATVSAEMTFGSQCQYHRPSSRRRRFAAGRRCCGSPAVRQVRGDRVGGVVEGVEPLIPLRMKLRMRRVPSSVVPRDHVDQDEGGHLVDTPAVGDGDAGEASHAGPRSASRDHRGRRSRGGRPRRGCPCRSSRPDDQPLSPWPDSPVSPPAGRPRRGDRPFASTSAASATAVQEQGGRGGAGRWVPPAADQFDSVGAAEPDRHGPLTDPVVVAAEMSPVVTVECYASRTTGTRLGGN